MSKVNEMELRGRKIMMRSRIAGMLAAAKAITEDGDLLEANELHGCGLDCARRVVDSVSEAQALFNWFVRSAEAQRPVISDAMAKEIESLIKRLEHELDLAQSFFEPDPTA
jgi:hypothetical protein